MLQKSCREEDIIARLGGDEFVILLPKTDETSARLLIERIEERASNARIGSVDVSISFGYSSKHSEKENIQSVLKKAEDAMYNKKLYESPAIRGKIIKSIMNMLNGKNEREERHFECVSELCCRLGEAMALSDQEKEALKLVGLLHDIGKIGIDEKLFLKPGPLNDKEWEEIRRHPEIGYRILSTVNDMSEMAEFVLAHHERWDGKGYPKGLKGEEIPFVSRIITIADAYDAMTNERSYRAGFSIEKALSEMQANAGIQFDPGIVPIFVKMIRDGVAPR